MGAISLKGLNTLTFAVSSLTDAVDASDSTSLTAPYDTALAGFGTVPCSRRLCSCTMTRLVVRYEQLGGDFQATILFIGHLRWGSIGNELVAVVL